MKLGEVCERLDQELRTDAFAEIDGSPNGLQVGASDQTVERAAFAVDAAQATIDAAAEVGADLLVVHHGLWWEGTERLTGRTYERVAALLEHDIALYVSHLPLDSHQEFGNAAQIGAELGLQEVKPFGSHGGEFIGQCGNSPTEASIDGLTTDLANAIDVSSDDIFTLSFGPTTIRSIAIVTGSGIDWLDEAVENGADALITGEGKQVGYHAARESGIHVLLAGHYATETGGVRALASLVEEWGIESTFLDHPTGL